MNGECEDLHGGSSALASMSPLQWDKLEDALG